MVRELVRQGVVKNSYAYPHCYVPVGRIRNLLYVIGCEGLEDHSKNRWLSSKIIYDFLKLHLGPEEAHFDLSFDLPLLAVAENKDLQMRFLREALPEEDDESVFEDLL